MPLPPLPSWPTPYIGTPFRELGRDDSGCDCWGLLRLVLRREKGIEVPVYGGIGYEAACDREELKRFMRGQIVEHWAPVWERQQDTPRDALPTGEQAFDGIWLRPHGMRQPVHVGLVVVPGVMLHIEHGCDAVVEDYYDQLRWRHRVVGIYRHASLAG